MTQLDCRMTQPVANITAPTAVDDIATVPLGATGDFYNVRTNDLAGSSPLGLVEAVGPLPPGITLKGDGTVSIGSGTVQSPINFQYRVYGTQGGVSNVATVTLTPGPLVLPQAVDQNITVPIPATGFTRTPINWIKGSWEAGFNQIEVSQNPAAPVLFIQNTGNPPNRVPAIYADNTVTPGTYTIVWRAVDIQNNQSTNTGTLTVTFT